MAALNYRGVEEQGRIEATTYKPVLTSPADCHECCARIRYICRDATRPTHDLIPRFAHGDKARLLLLQRHSRAERRE